MKSTYERLEKDGRIGPMENVGTKERPILQPRKDYRAEYPKLVTVGYNGRKPIKKLVQNSHEELMLKATASVAPSDQEVHNERRDQELASLKQMNAALMEKIEQMLAGQNTPTLANKQPIIDNKPVTPTSAWVSPAPSTPGQIVQKSPVINDILSPSAKATSALEDFKQTLKEPVKNTAVEPVKSDI